MINSLFFTSAITVHGSFFPPSSRRSSIRRRGQTSPDFRFRLISGLQGWAFGFQTSCFLSSLQGIFGCLYGSIPIWPLPKSEIVLSYIFIEDHPTHIQFDLNIWATKQCPNEWSSTFHFLTIDHMHFNSNCFEYIFLGSISILNNNRVTNSSSPRA